MTTISMTGNKSLSKGHNKHAVAMECEPETVHVYPLPFSGGQKYILLVYMYFSVLI